MSRKKAFFWSKFTAEITPTWLYTIVSSTGIDSPASLNPYGWWSTSDYTNVITSGIYVTGLYDLTSNNHNLINTTAGSSNKPTTLDTSFNKNGNRRIDFSSDWLRLSDPGFSSPLTIPYTYVIAFEQEAVTIAQQNILDGTGSVNRATFYKGATSNIYQMYSSANLSSGSFVTAEAGNFYIVFAKFDGGSSQLKIYSDGGSGVLGPPVIASGDPGTAQLDSLLVGARWDLAQLASVRPGEIFVFDKALNGNEESFLLNYLSGKWIEAPTPESGVSIPFYGAAYFSDGSGSTVSLPGRISLFSNSGDYIGFDYFYTTGNDYSVLGSVINSSTVLLSNTQISIINDAGTGVISLDGTLNTGVWNTILLSGDGSNINLYVNDVLQTGNTSVATIDVDIIGKNQDPYVDVRAMDFTPGNQDYLYSTPTVQIYGHTTGFWRAGSFYLDSSGNFTIYDSMENNSGWRIEVIQDSNQELLKFTVGNGTGTSAIVGNQQVYVGSWNHFYVHLEQVQSFGTGDVVVTGFCPEIENFYVGATRGTGQYFDGKLDGLYGGTGSLNNNQQTWLFDGGSGRAVDEFTAASTVPTGLLDFGYGLYQTNTGSRADDFGNNDLTISSSSPGSITSPLSLKSSFLNDAKFSGYLKNMRLKNGSFLFVYDLYSGTLDTGVAANNGTAFNVDFVSSDPTGLI